MMGSEVFSATPHRIFPSSSYRIHDHVVEPSPQVLDADHDLLGPAEASVTIKASEFKAIESLVRSSLSVLSYIEHFDVATTKLLQQLLTEVGQSSLESRSPRAQMLLNLKLSQARALSHLANIEAKLLGNVVLTRRDSFLALNKRAAASSTPVGQHDHPQSSHARAQPARSRHSHQSLPVSSTCVTPAKCGGHQTPGGPAKRP